MDTHIFVISEVKKTPFPSSSMLALALSYSLPSTHQMASRYLYLLTLINGKCYLSSVLVSSPPWPVLFFPFIVSSLFGSILYIPFLFFSSHPSSVLSISFPFPFSPSLFCSFHLLIWRTSTSPCSLFSWRRHSVKKMRRKMRKNTAKIYQIYWW